MSSLHSARREKLQANHFASKAIGLEPLAMSGPHSIQWENSKSSLEAVGTMRKGAAGGNALLAHSPCLQSHLVQLSINWAAKQDVIGDSGGCGQGGRKRKLILPPPAQPSSTHEQQVEFLPPPSLPGPQVQTRDWIQALQSPQNLFGDWDSQD